MAENSTQSQDRFFTDTFKVSVDGQHRAVFPKAWRLPSDTEETRFYLVPAPDKSIHLHTSTQFNIIVDALRKRASSNDVMAARYLAAFGGNSSQITLDKQGRFQFSPALCKHAELGDKVMFIGSILYAKIISEENWNKISPELEDSLNFIKDTELANNDIIL